MPHSLRRRAPESDDNERPVGPDKLAARSGIASTGPWRRGV